MRSIESFTNTVQQTSTDVMRSRVAKAINGVYNTLRSAAAANGRTIKIRKSYISMSFFSIGGFSVTPVLVLYDAATVTHTSPLGSTSGVVQDHLDLALNGNFQAIPFPTVTSRNLTSAWNAAHLTNDLTKFAKTFVKLLDDPGDDTEAVPDAHYTPVVTLLSSSQIVTWAGSIITEYDEIEMPKAKFF